MEMPLTHGHGHGSPSVLLLGLLVDATHALKLEDLRERLTSSITEHGVLFLSRPGCGELVNSLPEPQLFSGGTAYDVKMPVDVQALVEAHRASRASCSCSIASSALISAKTLTAWLLTLNVCLN